MNARAARYTKRAFAHYTGDGVPADAFEALSWFWLAAGAGSVEAIRELAFMYTVGSGTDPNPHNAARLYAMLQS